MDDLEKKLTRVYDNFGKKTQCKKLFEEVYELVEAINEYEYHGSKVHIEEEIADIYVLLKQFEIAYKLNKTNVSKNISMKVERTLDRIKNKYY